MTVFRMGISLKDFTAKFAGDQIDLFFSKMNAFVIAAEPIHENSVNYFSAALGFYRLGYFVERYKLSDLKNAEIDGETPVFGGIESLETVLPNYVGLPYYPTELNEFLFRSVEKRPVSEVRLGEFFKPLDQDHKLFSPQIRDDSFDCDLVISQIPEGTEVLAASPIEFVSEFRAYILRGDVLNICFYKGTPMERPDSTIVREMVARCAHYSSAFGLDVGVTADGSTALVEMNDFCCLGNYGLRATDYARCIAERWGEAWQHFAFSSSSTG